MYDVGTLGGSSAGSIIINMQGALNDLGHVVGASFLKGDQDFHPYFWKKGEAIRDIGTLGGRCGAAEAMNDADEVAGRADVSGPCGQLDNKYTHNPLADVRGVNAVHSPAGNVSHAFLWKPGMKKPKDLGTVKGDQNSYATAINGRHQIVGLSATESSGTYRAFLWESGGPMVDLNTLIPKNSSLYLNWAFDINDQGYIAGIGSPADCSDFDLCGHAFLLVPQ
jgi:probable HAF family extracellular repeat protein